VNESITPVRRLQPRAVDHPNLGPREPASALGSDAVLQFLTAAYSNPRAAVITRRSHEGWRSSPAAWPLERIAAGIHDPRWVVGIRPEGRIRAIWVDVDRKPDAVSPYWHPYGQSRQLQALEQEAAAAGCGFTLLRSSASGGLHGVVLLPDWLPAWLAHWVGAELVARAGMTLAAGACELFPSRLDYSKSADRNTWAQSHGVRLPGQEGSALLVGTRTASDTELIYEELLVQLEATEAGPAWEELLEAARARQKVTRWSRGTHRPLTPSKRGHGVRWTGSRQSNEHMRRLTTWARLTRPDVRTVPELAAITLAAAVSAPGFEQHASEETHQDIRNWAIRWARSSLASDWQPGTPTPEGRDKHHNSRLLKLTRAKLTRAWREAGAAAASWSQRKVAEMAQISRRTLCKHWDYWRQLLGGLHPCITGGPVSAVPSEETFDPAVSVPPAASAEALTIGATAETTPKTLEIPGFSDFWSRLKSKRPAAPPPDPVLPFRPEDPPPDPWRARQRAELAAWLGLAA
jgi:hypothetical protein